MDAPMNAHTRARMDAHLKAQLAAPPARPLNVVVCGGGRTGHANAVLFAQRPDVRVVLLTSQRACIDRHREGLPITAQLPDGRRLQARPALVTQDPAAALQDADVVVITVPAHARPALLTAIAPHLPLHKPVQVGAIPGFCGFDWLAERLLPDRPQAVVWGMKDVPHTAFDLQPGVSVRVGGAKARLHVATHDRETPAARTQLHAVLQQLFDAPVDMLRHYLEITLTPGNPIMHSAVICGLIGPQGPYHGRTLPRPLDWWTECSDQGAELLERMDAENQRLCRAAEARLGLDLSSVKPLKQEIVEAYGDQIADTRSMASVLRSNRAYAGIPAPLVRAPGGDGWVIDVRSRAFEEDVAFGLTTLAALGRRLAVPLPCIDETLAWCSAHMGGLRRSAADYFPAHWPTPPALSA
jgi:hypothetical protein